MVLFILPLSEEIRLRVAAVTATLRRRAMLRAAAGPVAHVAQPVQLLLWGEPMTRLVGTPSRNLPPKRQTRPAVAASVFDLARAPAKVRLCGAAEPPTVRIVRDGDRVRCERIQPQDTAEWQEREAARRARQKPPKPTKQARTRSKKFAALIGESERG